MISKKIIIYLERKENDINCNFFFYKFNGKLINENKINEIKFI